MRKKCGIGIRIFLAGFCCLAVSGCGPDENAVKNFFNGIENTIASASPDNSASADSTQTIAEGSSVDPEAGSDNPEATTANSDIATLEPGSPSLEATPELTPNQKDPGQSRGQEYLTGEWGTDLPQNHGVSAEWIAAFNADIMATPVRAALLVKDGSIIYEYYNEGDNADTQFSIYSCTKSITSAAVGIAIEQGLLPGIESKLEDFFPDLTDSQKKDITIRNLLTLTSGIEWKESVSSGVLVDWMLADNQVDYVLGRKMINKPGEVFNYSSGNTQLLSAILEKSAGMSEADYVRENIFVPLGIDDIIWWSDAQGITFGGFGIWMRARDAARFGQLYLNEGRWGDKQIVPADWVKVSTVPQNPNDNYGYNWWIDLPEPEQEFRMYNASGAGGQHIFIIPDYQVVAVVMCNDAEDRSIEKLVKKHLMKW